jgi:putative hydrolase of the HAD superfamily
MIDTARVTAITLDLDDTLWPVMPTLVRAEAALGDWLATRAPLTGALFADTPRRLALRQEVLEQHPEYLHDLSFQRLRALALGLERHGEDPALAEPAFEVFFAARQQVDLYPQATEVLQRLSGRYPLLAVSNGNADVVRVGIGAYFSGSVSARDAGVAKPDPRIFHAAAAHLDCALHQVLHVGDDHAADVVGAAQAGMQAVWLRHPTALEPLHSAHAHLVVEDLRHLCEVLGV